MTTTTDEPAATTYDARGPRTGVWVVLAAAAILIVVAILWFQGVFKPKHRIAVVTAAQGPYWDLIAKGAQEAAQRYGVRVEVFSPGADEPSQTKKLRELIDEGYDGVAVSPNDPLRQARTLAELASKSKLVTYDADGAVAGKLCFVGTDNYDAGRMCGAHVKECLPNGGNVIISIGSLEKENGHRRRQGVIDELLGRSTEPNRPQDPVEKPISATTDRGTYTILTTLVDNLSQPRATELAVAAIKSGQRIDCFVGLFASTTPAILKALEQTGKLGQIKVVAFDAHDDTLAGIEKGHVHSSTVQDAYNIGYQTVRILAEAAGGDPNAIQMFPTFHLRCDEVTSENLAAFKDSMASRHKPGRRTAPPSAAEAESPGAAPPATQTSPSAAPSAAPASQ